MPLKTIYLLPCIIGAAVPYSQFLPWLHEYGFHGRFFIQQLFANRISAFFGMDVLVSAVVLIVFMRTESRRLDVKSRWLPVAALCLVGVSMALPLFLYLREEALERPKAQSPG